MLKALKLNLLSVFRELFVYHHYSLEFRAKLFAAIISADEKADEKIYEELEKIASEIYGKDEARVGILVRTTKEYVKKVITNNGLNLDQLVFDIDRILKYHKRYVKKINIEHLKRLQNKENESIALVQQRIIEFAESEIENIQQKSIKKKK